eukprot:gene9186-16323_t
MADVEDAEEETLESQRGSLSLRESMWDVMDVKQEEVDEEEVEDEEEAAVGPGRGSQSQRESPGGSQRESMWDVMDVKQEEVDEEEEVAVGLGRGSQSQRESPGGSQRESMWDVMDVKQEEEEEEEAGEVIEGMPGGKDPGEDQRGGPPLGKTISPSTLPPCIVYIAHPSFKFT